MTIQATEPLLMRVGDADRRRVIQQLSAHCAQGRLDVQELDSRIAAAWSSRTRGDLEALTADLPTPDEPRTSEPTLGAWLRDGRALMASLRNRVLLLGASGGLLLLVMALLALVIGHHGVVLGPDEGH